MNDNQASFILNKYQHNSLKSYIIPKTMYLIVTNLLISSEPLNSILGSFLSLSY